MKAIFILMSFISLILFSTVVKAQVSISCPSCYINNCQCSIINCTNGTVKIYNTTDCSGIPKYQYSFLSNSLTWSPPENGNYYFKILCSDENVSTCIPVSVSPIQTTTTTQGGGSVSGRGDSGVFPTTTLPIQTTTTSLKETTTTTSPIQTTTTLPIKKSDAVIKNYYFLIFGAISIVVVIGICVFLKKKEQYKKKKTDTLKNDNKNVSF